MNPISLGRLNDFAKIYGNFFLMMVFSSCCVIPFQKSKNSLQIVEDYDCIFFKTKMNLIENCDSISNESIVGSWYVKEQVYGFFRENCWDTINLITADKFVYHANGKYQAGLLQIYAKYEIRNGGKTLYHKNARREEEFYGICINQDTMHLMLNNFDDVKAYVKLVKK